MCSARRSNAAMVFLCGLCEDKRHGPVAALRALAVWIQTATASGSSATETFDSSRNVGDVATHCERFS
jgi:hypothetical protein